MSDAADFELKTPDSVKADANAVELLRMWWSNNEPVMSVKPAFNDPGQFGQMLAIAARHMAHGYAVRHGHNEQQAYNAILLGLSDTIRADNLKTVVEPGTTTGTVQ